ncbi:MAG: protein kinase [Anaerolineae bacterium]|nr:MAG: protein kinase [Anaerolineae bacterium]
MGGMGAVYLARDLRFRIQRYVAVKEIVAQIGDESVRRALLNNFEREANILAALNHPSIPKIHDYFTLDNRTYLVMEFIEGKDLEKILNETEGLLPVQQVVIWGIELCDVLYYLHTREPEPIVFRDIKPSNIMITPENHVVLVDFGIAKKFEAGQKGTMIGTEGYSPPEQYRGEASPQVDIYALGATLHHLLTGIDPRDHAPFTFNERPIRQLNPNVPTELEVIVDTALQYNPEDRFRNANEMKDALIRVARRGGSGYSKGTAAIYQHMQIEPLWVFESEDEIRGTALYHQGRLFIGSYDHNVYALDAESGQLFWKFPAERGVVSTPAYYNRAIYFGSEDQYVYAVSALTGTLQWKCYTDAEIRSSPAISDRHVFIGSDDGRLYIINADTGRIASDINTGAPIRSTPLVAMDHVFFGNEHGDMICSDFSGKIRWQMSARRAITSSARYQDGAIYFGSVDGHLYAVDAKTGWTIWRFRMEKGTISSPWLTEKFAYIGSADGHIYCINLQTSKAVWQYKTGHQVSSSPVVSHDAVYCGSVDGSLYCLDAQTGALRWRFETGGPITGSPVLANNMVFIGSTDHKLYAIPA